MSVELRTPRSTISAVLPFRAIPNRPMSGEDGEGKGGFLSEI
jgi:hypothetical protein